MSEPVSALEGARAEPRPGLVVEDLGPVGMVTLRGDLASEPVAAAVGRIAGTAVPGALSAVAGADGARVVWMAPDELLMLVRDYAAASAVEAAEQRALAGAGALVLNVTGARSVFRLTGAAAAETLAKGAPVDVSDAAFPVGHARRTQTAGLAVVFWRSAPQVYEIACLRSCAHHLFDWLTVAGRAGAEVGRF